MLADRILSEESLTTWMYLDTADRPVVTCGIGHALFILEDCLALPWNQPKTVVQQDYQTIAGKPPGYRAEWYKQFTASRLTETFVRDLLERDIDRQVKILRGHFVRYREYPEPAREALGDMAFQLGGNFPRTWPQFSQSVRNEDWSRAAACCHRKNISEQRNRDTAALFLAASEQESPSAA
jgi:GH24 family phage-related lysozyme (muramidase)